MYSARRRDPGKRAVARTPPLAAPPPRVDRPRLPCRPHAYLSTEGYVNHVDRARPPPHPHTTNVPRPPHPRPRASQRVTAPAEGRSFTRGTRPRAPQIASAWWTRPGVDTRPGGTYRPWARVTWAVSDAFAAVTQLYGGRPGGRVARGIPAPAFYTPRGTTWNANATPLALKLQNPTSERKTGEARKQQPRHFFLERSPSAAQRVLGFRRALVASLFHGRDLL